MILSIYLKMPLKYVCIKMSFFVISIDAPKLVQNLPSPESISNQKNVPNESQKKNIKIKSQIIKKPQIQNEEREPNFSLSLSFRSDRTPCVWIPIHSTQFRFLSFSQRFNSQFSSIRILFFYTVSVPNFCDLGNSLY